MNQNLIHPEVTESFETLSLTVGKHLKVSTTVLISPTRSSGTKL